MTAVTYLCIDTGTTTSRVWLVDNGSIVQSTTASVGVRDTARDGNPGRLRSALKELIAEVRRAALRPPMRVAAAGMITSSLGLHEVPHVAAPAGLREIATGAVEIAADEICDLPMTLFPGVRSGPWGDRSAIGDTDIMRGEETLCMGLVNSYGAEACTVLSLGSHWKSISSDVAGRITSSRTTLSGELLHAVMTQTVLASAVPSGKPESVDGEWCLRGADEFEKRGLSRMLFTVRLWELQAPQISPGQRLSYLIGGMVAEALSHSDRGHQPSQGPVLIVGEGGVAAAWQLILNQRGATTVLVTSEQSAAAFVRGIGQLLAFTPSGGNRS